MRRYVFEDSGAGFQSVADEDLGLSLQLSLSPKVGHTIQKVILSGHGLGGECRFRCACPVEKSLKNSINTVILTAKDYLDRVIAEIRKTGSIGVSVEIGLIEFALLDQRKSRLLEYSCMIDEVLEGTICVNTAFYEQIHQALHLNDCSKSYRANEYFGQSEGIWLELEDLTESPSPFFDVKNPIDLDRFKSQLQTSGHLLIPSKVYLTLLTALLYSFEKHNELFAEQADLFLALQEHVFYAQPSNSLYDELFERIAEREREKSGDGNAPS